MISINSDTIETDKPPLRGDLRARGRRLLTRFLS